MITHSWLQEADWCELIINLTLSFCNKWPLYEHTVLNYTNRTATGTWLLTSGTELEPKNQPWVLVVKTLFCHCVEHNSRRQCLQSHSSKFREWLLVVPLSSILCLHLDTQVFVPQMLYGLGKWNGSNHSGWVAEDVKISIISTTQHSTEDRDSHLYCVFSGHLK